MTDHTKRRRHVSFKNNDREEELLKWLDEKSKVLGTSTYIKLLLEQDMEKSKKKGE